MNDLGPITEPDHNRPYPPWFPWAIFIFIGACAVIGQL